MDLHIIATGQLYLLSLPEGTISKIDDLAGNFPILSLTKHPIPRCYYTNNQERWHPLLLARYNDKRHTTRVWLLSSIGRITSITDYCKSLSEIQQLMHVWGAVGCLLLSDMQELMFIQPE